MKLKSPTGIALAAAVGSNANNLRTSSWVRSCKQRWSERSCGKASMLLISAAVPARARSRWPSTLALPVYKYGDGSIWDARDNARAAAHMFLVQAEKFRWALGHYPDYAERYMVHQQGIQGAIEHYTHPERIAWQSMCATDEGVLKGEQWCKKCIWGNLLPEWKRAFGDVDNIQSGEFIALWTGRIDHFADRYSVAPADTVVSATPKDNARRLTAVARSNVRSLRSHASHLRARIAVAARTHSRLSPARRRHIARSSGRPGAHKRLGQVSLILIRA
jgi:predicted GIY-YIG superfamily endonuclease